MKAKLTKDSLGHVIVVTVDTTEERQAFNLLQHLVKKQGAVVRFCGDSSQMDHLGPGTMTVYADASKKEVDERRLVKYEVIEGTYTCMCGKEVHRECVASGDILKKVAKEGNTCCTDRPLILTHVLTVKDPSLQQILEAYGT